MHEESDEKLRRTFVRANEMAAAARTTRLWAHERLTGLTSVVFGLSFLALQVDKPEGLWFAAGAWISLGVATLLSALITTFEWRRRDGAVRLARSVHLNLLKEGKLDKDELVDQFEITPTAIWRMHVLVLGTLFIGIVLLITFAICNS